MSSHAVDLAVRAKSSYLRSKITKIRFCDTYLGF